MASPAFRSSHEILQPLFEYLCNPDPNVSLSMIRTLSERLPFEYQRAVARGMSSLIDGDAEAARSYFASAENAAPSDQLTFVLSNAGVSFHAAKFYADELNVARKSSDIDSPHLLKYAFFVCAKRCDYELFIKVANRLKKLGVDPFCSGDEDIDRMITNAADCLTILANADEYDRDHLNRAATLMHSLAEQEKLSAEEIRIWKDDEDSYCYGLFLSPVDRGRYREMNKKLDELVLSSNLDFVRVTPLIFHGGQ